jgi:hypothetical protein
MLEHPFTIPPFHFSEDGEVMGGIAGARFLMETTRTASMKSKGGPFIQRKRSELFFQKRKSDASRDCKRPLRILHCSVDI